MCKRRITGLTPYLQNKPDNSLNRFVFLDSQDWMPPEAIAETLEGNRPCRRTGERASCFARRLVKAP